jgi:hypothetical protein
MAASAPNLIANIAMTVLELGMVANPKACNVKAGEDALPLATSGIPKKQLVSDAADMNILPEADPDKPDRRTGRWTAVNCPEMKAMVAQFAEELKLLRSITVNTAPPPPEKNGNGNKSLKLKCERSNCDWNSTPPVIANTPAARSALNATGLSCGKHKNKLTIVEA